MQRRTRQRRRRGAALVEAAILLPFLTIVFAGAVYIGRRELAQQHALLTARSCAWRYALGACTALPPGCPEELFQKNSSPDPDPLIREQVMEARAATDSAGQGAFAAAVRDKVDGILFFVLSDTVTTRAVRTIAVPSPLHGAPGEARASYYLPCNLAPLSPGRMAGELWDSLLGAFR
ncbi:MAG: hypothetical protein ABW217_15290 [Polyangiaceae bacterium]